MTEIATGVSTTPDMLLVDWSDGTRSEHASLWLRDNRPEDRDAHSGQRLIDVADLPMEPRLAGAQLVGGRIEVRWHDGAPVTGYDQAWLRRHDAKLHRAANNNI